MSLLGNVLGGRGSSVSQAVDGQADSSGRPTTLTISDYNEQAHSTFTPGEKTPALRRRVSWGQEERFGSGMADKPRTVGTADVYLENGSGSEITSGQIHLVHNGPSKRDPEIVFSGSVTNLAMTDITSPGKEDREAIPERVNYDRATPEEHLEVWFEAAGSSDVTVNWDNSRVNLPATVYETT